MESRPLGERVAHRGVQPCGGMEPTREAWSRKRKTRACREPGTGGGKAAGRHSGTGNAVQRWGFEVKGAPAADRNRQRRGERKSRGKRCPVHGGRPTCESGGLMISTHKSIYPE